MADDIPAGWYPDAHGAIRWWDGQKWTDHIREGSRATTPPVAPKVTETVVTPVVPVPEPAVPAVTQPVATPGTHAATPATPTGVVSPAATPSWGTQSAATQTWVGRTEPALDVHRPTPRVSYPPKPVDDEPEEDTDSGNRRLWLTATAVGLATFFLGMGLGGQTAQPRQASDPLPPAVGGEPADIEQLRQQLADRQAELDERLQVLDEREDELDRRASEPPSPSPSATTATPTPTPSPDATATTISGDDNVLIGTDVREGTYKTNGPTDPDFECEYTLRQAIRTGDTGYYFHPWEVGERPPAWGKALKSRVFHRHTGAWMLGALDRLLTAFSGRTITAREAAARHLSAETPQQHRLDGLTRIKA